MAVKATGRKAKSEGKQIVLKAICQELKIEPKAARRTLRKAGLSFHGAKERWVFNPKQAAQVKQALQA